MLSDAEFEKLSRIVNRKKRPVATLAYELIAQAVRSTC